MPAASNSNMDRAPKKKDEFVARLSTTTCIPLVTLQEMSLEKLRMVYQHAKPIMFRPLPANWKRFSKPELQKLYAEKVIPWAGLDPQTYYDHLQWNKDRLVVELTLYAEEAAKEDVDIPASPVGPPTCPSCRIKMIKRVNCMTQEPFWACITFPQCKQTFAMEYYGKPAAEVQKNLGKDGLPTSKESWIDGGEEMDGRTVRRAARTPVPAMSEASWEPMQDGPMQLTAEEKELIEKLRKDRP